MGKTRRKRFYPRLYCDQMAKTYGRYPLIRGTPFKTIIAPLLAANAVVHEE